MKSSARDWAFALVIGSMCVGLAFVDLAGVPAAPHGLHARGLVTEVDNSNVRVHLIVKTQAQVLQVRLLDGPHEGQTVAVTNMLTGKMELDEFYEPGAVILVEYDVAGGEIRNAGARGHYRLRLQVLLIVLFAVLLVAVSGVTGLKAALSFGFSAMVLWKLFFPLLLRGLPPVPTGLAITALLTAVITLSVGGLNRRGLVTFTGSMLGVLVTCGLALWFTSAFHLHGAVQAFAETLLYSGHTHLRLTDIFVASVFVGSCGAIMDLAMDIAASMDEIKKKNPDIGFREHVQSGLRVGHAVVGTMTTTLLLAYSGAHVAMFMLFMAKGLPVRNILNAPFVAAEILNTLVGSFGVVTVAPFTVLVAGLIYRRSARKPQIAGKPEVDSTAQDAGRAA